MNPAAVAGATRDSKLFQHAKLTLDCATNANRDLAEGALLWGAAQASIRASKRAGITRAKTLLTPEITSCCSARRTASSGSAGMVRLEVSLGYRSEWGGSDKGE